MDLSKVRQGGTREEMKLNTHTTRKIANVTSKGDFKSLNRVAYQVMGMDIVRFKRLKLS